MRSQTTLSLVYAHAGHATYSLGVLYASYPLRPCPSASHIDMLTLAAELDISI